MTLVRLKDWRLQGIDELEPRAWEVLREARQSVCVTAGAGAGKTEFLAQKAAYLLQTGLCPAPKRILAISFKRDAAQNLAERVEKRCSPEQARRFNSFTFDAFNKNLLDRFRDAVPKPWRPSENYRIVTATRGDKESFLENHGFHGIGISDFDEALSNIQLPFDANTNKHPAGRAVQEYWQSQYHDYQDVLVTFPMINRLVEWTLRENPIIRRAIQITYPFVFLDEFQDTTHAQFGLLKTVFESNETIFTCVGDDKQRIMVWAGAMPDAFSRFESDFSAKRISLLRNYRSHEDLVAVQHVIASQIDRKCELPEAMVGRTVDGDIAAIWEFSTNEEESEWLAEWIKREVKELEIEPHEIAILARLRVDNVEDSLAQSFSKRGLRLRNVSRNVGEISIQDLLSEDLTAILLPILRLLAERRNPDNWNKAIKNLQHLEGIAFSDEDSQQKMQLRLQTFIREIRNTTLTNRPTLHDVKKIALQVLKFVGKPLIQRTYPAYQRNMDFDRVWEGFVSLLTESVERVYSWTELLDDFEGRGQIALMTIHRSKGLEFHTMIFYGLDNRTWWSLEPNNREEINSFYVAFTRAKQRAFFTLCTERGQPVIWIEELLKPAGVLRQGHSYPS